MFDPRSAALRDGSRSGLWAAQQVGCMERKRYAPRTDKADGAYRPLASMHPTPAADQVYSLEPVSCERSDTETDKQARPMGRLRSHEACGGSGPPEPRIPAQAGIHGPMFQPGEADAGLAPGPPLSRGMRGERGVLLQRRRPPSAGLMVAPGADSPWLDHGAQLGTRRRERWRRRRWASRAVRLFRPMAWPQGWVMGPAVEPRGVG